MKALEDEVMEKIQELKEEMSDIHAKINEVLVRISLKEWENEQTWIFDPSSKKDFEALSDYERWYNSAYPLIVEYLPDKKDEFRERHDIIRSGIELDMGYIRENNINSKSELTRSVANSVVLQTSMLDSIPGRVESESLKAKKEISTNIVSNEVQKAKELYDDRDIRAAGVIAGVALERHLLTLCESSEQELEFDYMDGITSLATTLNTANEIGDDDKRLLEYLGGVRNKCSHASDEEPEKREVERMLNQTDEFIRS